MSSTAEPYGQQFQLEDVSEIIQQAWFDKYEEQWPTWFGLVTNRMFKPDMLPITGDGRKMIYELGPGDNLRSSTDMLGAFSPPRAFDPATITVRFSKTTPSSNDFVRVSASCQTNDIDLEAGNNGSIIDFVERLQKQITEGQDEYMAIKRNVGRTGALGLVNGTPKANNGNCIDATAGDVAATSTATNALGARFKVDGGSISFFRANRRLDIYSSAGVLRAGNVKVTDNPNPVDYSMGVSFTSGNSQDSENSTGDLSTITDNDVIYLSGERNAGMYSLDSYFGAATAGESFLGGVDRTTAGYGWMRPVTLNYTSTAPALTKSHIDSLAIAQGFRQESEIGAVFTSEPTLTQKLRNEYTEAAFLNIPDGDNRLKRYANLGSMGLNYQHPTYGLVKIVTDVLQRPGTLRVNIPEHWRTLQYGVNKGLKMMPGQRGGWYRVTETTPNTGLSMIWKCDWYGLYCDWCFKPWKLGQIIGVTA